MLFKIHFIKMLICNITTVIINITTINGLNLSNYHDFESKNNMATRHKYAKKYRKTHLLLSGISLPKGINNDTT